ncbi:MAG TPA: glycoside hydrolase family 2 TIM barrel-domain containing protein [Polyangia bacterium]|nr:glycoside hydrolase family 2 TIM barrel-domain containing protein [Polyangia bacterium]
MRRAGRLLVAASVIGLAISPGAGCGKGSGGGAASGGQPSAGGQSGGTMASGGSASGGSASGGIGAGGSSGAGGTATGGTVVSGAAGKGSGGAQSSGGQTGAGGSPSPDGGQPDGPRLIQNFNQSWKFKRADVSGADATAFDDSSWSDIGLPHSFNLPTFVNAKFYAGYGWYRKHFTVPATWSGKSVFLEFQAAFDQAQIYVNGKMVGTHIGGYNGFSIDVTPAIQGGDNVVAVRLNNNWNAQLPPITGDHTFQGGLYRDVFVVVTDPLHVTWYGTWVTTPTLAANAGASSTVSIKTEVQNNRAAAVNATLRTDIVDKDGKVVATVSSQQMIDANKTVTFDQTTPAIASPALWHPDHPTMYKALSYLSDASGTVDTFTTPFGFRWFSWTADKGFFLNGAHYWIQGGNVHQDHAGWGIGVSDSALYRDVKMVKDAGMNFIRGSHYPKAPAFADACDQLGVLLWSENCFWGGFGGGPGGWSYSGAYPSSSGDFDNYDANVLASLTDMIRIHRNHPSIIVWSMGNEDFFNGGGPADRVISLLKKSVALTHQLDPLPAGRPAAIGGAQSKLGGIEPGTLGDVAGYNGDGTGYNNPGIPNLVSEYGADVSSVRPGSYDPGWGNLSPNGASTQPAWRSGISRWCMFDYSSQMGTTYINSGIIDNFRIPKRSYYWYRNAYAKVAPPTFPAAGTAAGLTLTSSTTSLSAVDGTQDAWLLVTVVDAGGKPISNNVPVTLTIKSGPGEFPTGPSITFTPPGGGSASDIAIRDGQAAIEFRTYYAGTSVIEATSPGLTSGTVTITSHGMPAWVEGTTPRVASRPYQP